MPSSSYRGSSRQDSISSSFFGDTESKTDEIPVHINKASPDGWGEGELNYAFGGLGITETVSEQQAKSQPVPSLPTQTSAPAHLEVETIRKKPSAERINKRRPAGGQGRESAESGDDEDEELGNTQIRAKSPKTGRVRGASKLGYEMLRTNSRGSVISMEDTPGICDTTTLPSSPPPAITELPKEEDKATLTPPVVFPRLPGTGSEEIDMDSDEITTPRPLPYDSPDPDPTPRPSNAGLPAIGESSPSPLPK
jgi:serine/threonine-protein kinase RIM15